MGERVHYSSVEFKKNSRRESAATQDEDVTYSEVRTINSASSATERQSGLAEGSAGSSHPYRRAAVCVGLLCVLLLTATLVLCVLYSSLSQKYSLLERELRELRASNWTLKRERDQLLRDYSSFIQEKEQRDQLQKDYNRLKQILQRDHSAVFEKLPFVDQNCPSSSQKRECEPCPLGWEQFDSKCYFFSTELKTWTESRNACIEQRADLVIINSEEEQDFMNKNIKKASWIGLSDTVTEGAWLWVDGSPLQGGFWRRGKPDDQYQSYSGTLYQGADCAVTELSDNVWMDTSCFSFYGFICETDALLL